MKDQLNSPQNKQAKTSNVVNRIGIILLIVLIPFLSKAQDKLGSTNGGNPCSDIQKALSYLEFEILDLHHFRLTFNKNGNQNSLNDRIAIDGWSMIELENAINCIENLSIYFEPLMHSVVLGSSSQAISIPKGQLKLSQLAGNILLHLVTH